MTSPKRSDRHRPARWSAYHSAHEAHLDQLTRDGFVCANDLQWRVLAQTVELKGHIGCMGGIVVRVHKLLRVTGDPVLLAGGALPADVYVETVKYSYNVHRQGGGDLFRYDNTHHEAWDHEDDHHVHRFDPVTGEESIEWVGADRWPTLGAVIEEARSLYWELVEPLGLDDQPPDPAKYRTA